MIISLAAAAGNVENIDFGYEVLLQDDARRRGAQPVLIPVEATACGFPLAIDAAALQAVAWARDGAPPTATNAVRRVAVDADARFFRFEGVAPAAAVLRMRADASRAAQLGGALVTEAAFELSAAWPAIERPADGVVYASAAVQLRSVLS